MRTWQKYCAGLATLASLTPSLWSQAVPPAPAPAAAAAAAAPAKEGFFMRMKKAKKECLDQLCATPLGQLLNNSMKPVSAATGGIIGGLCPEAPSDKDLAALKAKDPSGNGAEAAAGEIKQKEADAKARRAAVRYLGTVDCHWYPKAQAALIHALYDDENECVRMEAAIALGRGCCCNASVLKHLAAVVNGTKNKLRPPAVEENSERVKMAAYLALQRCLACVEEPAEQKPEEGKPRDSSGTKPPDRKTSLDKATDAEHRELASAIEEAKRALAAHHPASAHPVVSTRPSGTVADLLSQALAPRDANPAASTEALAPVPMETPVRPVVSPAPRETVRPAYVSPAAIPVPTSAAPAPRHVVQVSATVPAPTPVSTPVVAPKGMASVEQLIGVLHDSNYIEQREWAAYNLSNVNWKTHPEVVVALVNGARQDHSPKVRVMCIHGLTAMQVKADWVVKALQTMKSDSDSQVQQEVTRALALLSIN